MNAAAKTMLRSRMDMLQAQNADIYDTSYFDSLFRKFKNWFTANKNPQLAAAIFSAMVR